MALYYPKLKFQAYCKVKYGSCEESIFRALNSNAKVQTLAVQVSLLKLSKYKATPCSSDRVNQVIPMRSKGCTILRTWSTAVLGNLAKKLDNQPENRCTADFTCV